jgi:hypothetical protein
VETPVDKSHLKAALAAAQTMKADSVAAEVSAALRAEGIRCIVVKGPSTARLLYDPTELRPYADCDLLVSPSGFDLARPVLEGLGFTEHPEQADHPERGLPHAIPWTRNDGGHVDLHRNLSGTGVAPAAVWRVLIQRTEPLMLSGELVAVPDAAGVALQVALHAGQHDQGAAAAKPRADLARAVQRLSPDVWREAVVLADSLAATGALTVGLRLDPEGSKLADLLGLPSPEFLDSSRHARIASGVGRLAATRGRRAQIRLAFAELFPSAEFMRWWSPLARRGGTAGLLAAYGERALWLVRQLGPSLALARRSRR